MTAQNKLEIKGTLQTNPLAELLAEACAANLSGSLRLAGGDQKIIIYLTNGKPVFAVSNARRHRLFEILLQNNKIEKTRLAEIPNFTNDLELAQSLINEDLLSKTEIDESFSVQIEEIIKSALGWQEGEWIFTPLARVKENIQFEIPLQKILLEYARSLPNNSVVRRFRSFSETFGANPSADVFRNDLLPQEAFVLSRFERSFLKVEEIRLLSGLADVATLKILYNLWLGGFLYRQNWNPAFSERKISEITSARLSLKKEKTEAADEMLSQTAENVIKPLQQSVVTTPPPADDVQPEVQVSEKDLLEDYLTRTENYASYYELFDISPDAELSEIKRTYFALAKRFHPDRYHQEKNTELLQRVQNAFTQAAQAYETLKNEETRKIYDYKLGKDLLTPRRKAKSGEEKKEQSELAKESFERGFSLLMDDEYEEALPFLARAVQLAPEVARYHAYYGKVLSMDESLRHKADAEMQTALRIEPQNVTFRLIMAEFYIQFDLKRRAEGELQRLLAIDPNNKEALELLKNLHNK